MSEVAEQVADVVAENVEEAIDGVVEVVEVFRNNPTALLAAGVVGLGLGAVGGYFLARKLLESEYAERAEEEIAQSKAYYAELNKERSPQEVMKALHGDKEASEALSSYQGDEGEPDIDPEDEAQILSIERRSAEEVRVKTPYREAFKAKEEKSEINMFADDTFDLEEETKFRTEDKPYIITHDEYFENERDFEQWAYTFYEVDGVLTDENDKPVEQVDELVGEDHFARFGSGSKDPNVVYVRNDRMGVIIEVTRSKGSYLEEVLGIPDEDEKSLKHGNRNATLNRRRAFRHGDG